MEGKTISKLKAEVREKKMKKTIRKIRNCIRVAITAIALAAFLWSSWHFWDFTAATVCMLAASILWIIAFFTINWDYLAGKLQEK